MGKRILFQSCFYCSSHSGCLHSWQTSFSSDGFICQPHTHTHTHRHRHTHTHTHTHTHHTPARMGLLGFALYVIESNSPPKKKKKKKKKCGVSISCSFLHGHWLSFLLHPVNYNGTNYSTGQNELTKPSVMTAKHNRKLCSLAVMVSVFLLLLPFSPVWSFLSCMLT